MKNCRSLTFAQLLFRCGFTFVVLVFGATLVLFRNQSDTVTEPENESMIHVKRPPVIDNDGSSEIGAQTVSSFNNVDASHIHVSLVTCGDENRVDRALVSIRSVAIFAKRPVAFHIFADFHLHDYFIQKLNIWPLALRRKMKYTFYPVRYPFGNEAEWRAIFKPCSSLRLFLPVSLSAVDSLIYLDTDTLTLTPIDELHNHFRYFNATQTMAMAPEAMDAATGWYNRFARHPYYGQLGLNSGVMLMNLTRMRNDGDWSRDIIDIYNEHKLSLTWGDQDILNIYLHERPDRVYVLGCEYNYVATFCMYTHVCKGAEYGGVKVAHGSKGYFHSEQQPVFRRLYKAFAETADSGANVADMLNVMVAGMAQMPRLGCGLVAKLFYKSIHTYVDSLNLTYVKVK